MKQRVGHGRLRKWGSSSKFKAKLKTGCHPTDRDTANVVAQSTTHTQTERKSSKDNSVIQMEEGASAALATKRKAVVQTEEGEAAALATKRVAANRAAAYPEDAAATAAPKRARTAANPPASAVDAAAVEGRCSLAALVATERHVFFNPLQVLQRDLSVLCARVHFASSLSSSQSSRDRRRRGGAAVLDAMCGGGVRAVRYALEVRGALE